MGKIAFMFSGQGDQFPGMGKVLYDKYDAAKAVFDMCDAIRPGTVTQCFSGTAEELKETVNTQPCLFAMELATASVLVEKGILPTAVAGFSLGEVVAATFSGTFDYDDGFRLVCKRGQLMQEEADKIDSAMTAVIRLPPEKVQEICSRYSGVFPVNYNCPGQITVSGLASQMADFRADVKEAGGRTLPLKVKGAFHSPYMKEAARAFAVEIAESKIKERNVPLYSNLTAKPYGTEVVEMLSAQICNPVQWEQLVRNLITDGVDTFLEIGPGKTLTNMVRRINAEVCPVNGLEYLAEVEAC